MTPDEFEILQLKAEIVRLTALLRAHEHEIDRLRRLVTEARWARDMLLDKTPELSPENLN